jgi:DNA-binding NtrC family response regulator
MSRILIIDDEESLLSILEHLFTREGYQVETAAGGTEGLAKIRAGEPPDLLITDIRMPDIDGIQVLREAKKIDPCLPVVIMTAQAEKQGAIDACNAGAYYFLEKPFENSGLLAICREALDFGRADRRYSARRRELSSALAPEYLLGEAPGFRQTRELAARAA